LFYCGANEVFWEDEEEEEEIEMEENTFREDEDELNMREIPYFFTPVYIYWYSNALKQFRSYACLYIYYKQKKTFDKKNHL
jgi:hypothetical protein